MSRWKTLITYLVAGDSFGVKTIELSNWIGKWIIIPRAKLSEIKTRAEVQSPAIYFLFGKNLHQQNVVYIGEAENLYSRLSSHDSKKDFWELVVAFVSKDNNLTKADIKYLEARAVEKAKQAKVFLLENSATPQLNNLPEYQRDTMEDFLDNIELLISFLGFPILTEVKVSRLEAKNEYMCKGPNAEGKGVYISEGFMVYKDSFSRKNVAEASKGGWIDSMQVELMAKWIIKHTWDTLVFLEDYTFSSPSAAAWFILGRQANGWTEWKMENGKSLDEIERKKL